MRHCVNDVRKGRQFLRRPMYRPAIPTAPKCGLRPHFGAGTQVLMGMKPSATIINGIEALDQLFCDCIVNTSAGKEGI